MNIHQQLGADPGLSAWVSANAGTGKTKVLTDRVLRLLLAGAEPTRILCLTYTKAAAAEMQQRIRKELARWVMMEAAALTAVLQEITGKPANATLLRRARALFAAVLEAQPGIRIETIHAFCQSVLRRFPLEAGVSPHFSIIDERTAGELVSEARLRLLSSVPANARLGEALAALTARLSEQGIVALLVTLIKERRKLQLLMERGGIDSLIAGIWKQLGLSRGVGMEGLLGVHFTYSAAEKEALARAAALMQESTSEAVQSRGRNVERWQRADPALRLLMHEDYVRAFITKEGPPLKELLLKAARDANPWAEETMRREQERVHGFAQKLRAVSIARLSEHITIVSEALFGIYKKLKSDRAFLDYDDLIILTLAMLRRPGLSAWVLFKLDGGLDHLLVDEAQDTAPEQWEMLRILCEELFSGEGARQMQRTLFVVGDEKQSIFSFQGAAPHRFDEMQRWFRRRIQDAQQPYEHIPLHLSYRSTEPVLSLVDRVFSPEHARKGLVVTESEVRHEVHRKDEPGRVELWELAQIKTVRNSDAWNEALGGTLEESAHGLLARRIAETIAGWIKHGRILPAKGRPVQAGDIMILLRRRYSPFVGALARALRRNGVPVAGLDRLVLTQHIAVRDMIALGEFLLLPEDDLKLAILLRSPLGGLSDDDLFNLAYERGKASLWQRLTAAAADDKRLATAHDFLADLLSHADRVPPYDLYIRALDTLGGQKRMGERLGEEAYELLDEFCCRPCATRHRIRLRCKALFTGLPHPRKRSNATWSKGRTPCAS